jgi:hypothetical protein
MKIFTCINRAAILLLSSVLLPATVFAQFQYQDWNIGIGRSSMTIENGMSRTAVNQNGVPVLTDSLDSHYKGMTNVNIHVEGLNTKFYVGGNFSIPINKVQERDSATVVGGHAEYTMKFSYGFSIKERVGIQFGLNMGIVNVHQTRNLKISGEEKWDYFIPSGQTPGGNQYFGEMAAWEIGLLLNTVVGITDNLGLRMAYSHNNVSLKKKTIGGRNDQFEFAVYYANPEMHNLGFSLGMQYSKMHFNPSTYENTPGGGFPRVYPATRVTMSMFYIGINLPIVFGG